MSLKIPSLTLKNTEKKPSNEKTISLHAERIKLISEIEKLDGKARITRSNCSLLDASKAKQKIEKIKSRLVEIDGVLIPNSIIPVQEKSNTNIIEESGYIEITQTPTPVEKLIDIKNSIEMNFPINEASCLPNLETNANNNKNNYNIYPNLNTIPNSISNSQTGTIPKTKPIVNTHFEEPNFNSNSRTNRNLTYNMNSEPNSQYRYQQNNFDRENRERSNQNRSNQNNNDEDCRKTFLNRLNAIPTFSGNSRAELMEFVDICDSLSAFCQNQSEYAELIMQIAIQLRGEAREVLSMDLEWEEMKKNLFHQFAYLSNKEIINSKIENMKQQPNETLMEYADKTRKLLFEKNKSYDYITKDQRLEHDRIIARAFSKGLIDEKLRERMLLCGVKSLENCISRAIEIDNDSVNYISNMELYCRFCQKNGHRINSCKRKDQFNSPLGQLLSALQNLNLQNNIPRKNLNIPSGPNFFYQRIHSDPDSNRYNSNYNANFNSERNTNYSQNNNSRYQTDINDRSNRNISYENYNTNSNQNLNPNRYSNNSYNPNYNTNQNYNPNFNTNQNFNPNRNSYNYNTNANQNPNSNRYGNNVQTNPNTNQNSHTNRYEQNNTYRYNNNNNQNSRENIKMQVPENK